MLFFWLNITYTKKKHTLIAYLTITVFYKIQLQVLFNIKRMDNERQLTGRLTRSMQRAVAKLCFRRELECTESLNNSSSTGDGVGIGGGSIDVCQIGEANRPEETTDVLQVVSDLPPKRHDEGGGFGQPSEDAGCEATADQRSPDSSGEAQR